MAKYNRKYYYRKRFRKYYKSKLSNRLSLNFYKAKIVMEYLFPIPSPYEIIDYSFINLSFNVAYSLDKEIIKSTMVVDTNQMGRRSIEAMSEYKENYRKYSLEESIRLTEG